MNTLRGSRTETATSERRRRAPSRALIISIVVHVVVMVALARMLVSPGALSVIFGRTEAREVVPERIGFLRLPAATDAPPVEGRSGGDNRPASVSTPERIVAPAVVPATIPEPAITGPAAREPEGSGPLVGSGGPTRGIRPTYTGPRVWAAPGNIVVAPKSAKQRLDSAIVSIIGPIVDSVETANAARSPRDWTFERNGRKWGLDSQFIRLGKVSIPSAVLAVLPINLPNPIALERNKLQNQLHADIFWNAQRGMNEADFKKAVRSIRERKERERAAEEVKKARQPDEGAAPQVPSGGS